MPDSYDSWKLASPPEPDYDDYQRMIKEKMEDVKGICENICEEADPECEYEDSSQIYSTIDYVERQLKKLKELANEVAEMEDEQGCPPPNNW